MAILACLVYEVILVSDMACLSKMGSFQFYSETISEIHVEFATLYTRSFKIYR